MISIIKKIKAASLLRGGINFLLEKNKYVVLYKKAVFKDILTSMTTFDVKINYLKFDNFANVCLYDPIVYSILFLSQKIPRCQPHYW